jgi:hypothetical protein
MTYIVFNLPWETKHDVEASKLFLPSRLWSAISLRTLCSAAMMRWRCTINEQFLQMQSFHLHRPLWPFSGQMTPWFLQRAHFGETVGPLSLCLLRVSLFRTTAVLISRVSLLYVDALCEWQLYIGEELYTVVGNLSSGLRALLPLNIITDQQWGAL